MVKLGGAAVAVIVVVLLINGSHDTQSVSHVIREIHGIALAEPDGGLIGTWWVSAAGIDPLVGELKSFKLDSGSMRFAAKSAKVVVDHETDTFKFEMWDVVLARVSESGEEGIEHELVDLDRYTLGPIPYRADIVPDRGSASQGARRLPYAGVDEAGTEARRDEGAK